MIKEIAFTTYPVTDLKRSREFYEGVLGLTPSDEYKDSEFWVEYNLGPNTFALGCMPTEWKPSPDGANIAFEVDDLDKMLEELRAKNIEVHMDKQDFPNCCMAIINDPDKNKIVLHHKK